MSNRSVFGGLGFMAGSHVSNNSFSKKFLFIPLVGFMLAGLSGCSFPAANYRPSVKDVQELRNVAHKKVGVGEFSAKKGDEKVNQFSLRGSTMVSPDGTFEKYLENAVTDELKMAGKYNPDSKIKLSGMLIKNAVDASGTSVGTADLEAEFSVDKNGHEVYHKIKTIHYQWPSAFAGSIAIPAVQTNYPLAVQKLLESLFNDDDFIMAVK